MTATQRRKIEADYGQSAEPRRVLAKCAAGLLVVLAIAASGAISGGVEDPVRAALSAPPAASDR